MSGWAQYVDNMEKSGAHCSGIYVKDTGVLCAQSKNLNISPQEIEMIKNCMAKKDSRLEVGGQPCVMTKSDDDFVEGKSKAAGDDGNKVFYHCEVTNKYIVVVGKTGAGERDASSVCNKITSYLKSLGE